MLPPSQRSSLEIFTSKLIFAWGEHFNLIFNSDIQLNLCLVIVCIPVCLSVAVLKLKVKGNVCRKFVYYIVHIKKRSFLFLTSCVFWFVFLNGSSHLRFWLFGLHHRCLRWVRLACRSRRWLCSGISIIHGHIWLWRFDNDSSDSVFFTLERVFVCETPKS